MGIGLRTEGGGGGEEKRKRREKRRKEGRVKEIEDEE